MRIVKGRWRVKDSKKWLRDFFFMRSALPVRKNPERLPAIHADTLSLVMPYLQLLSADIDPDTLESRDDDDSLP